MERVLGLYVHGDQTCCPKTNHFFVFLNGCKFINIDPINAKLRI